jgi:hypothetical protein
MATVPLTQFAAIFQWLDMRCIRMDVRVRALVYISEPTFAVFSIEDHIRYSRRNPVYICVAAEGN